MAITWLFEHMADWKVRPALAWHDATYEFAWLLGAVDDWRKRLDQDGMKPGQVVALQGDYSPNTVALLLALIDRDAVVVLLSRTVEAHRDEFLQIAEVQAVYAFDEEDRWRFQRREATITNALLRSLIAAGEPGLVLFSSGSTGKPRASLHNLTRFLIKFVTPRAPLRSMAVPLMDHVAGLDTLLYSLSSGGLLICPRDLTAETICQAIEHYRADLLPASATFLNLLLLSEAFQRYDLSSLRLVAYGSEVMPERTLARLREVLPKAKFIQKYGITELGSPRTRSREDGSLWVKIDSEGYEVKVVEGILWIRAQSAMMGYLNAPSPFDEEGWLNTGDVVEVDGEYLRILGRRSEMISVGGQKLHPAEVESVLLQMDNIRDATVYGEKNPIMGQIVAARVVLAQPESLTELKRRIRGSCRDKLAPYKIPVKVEIAEHEQFSARFKKMRRLAGNEP